MLSQRFFILFFFSLLSLPFSFSFFLLKRGYKIKSHMEHTYAKFNTNRDEKRMKI